MKMQTLTTLAFAGALALSECNPPSKSIEKIGPPPLFLFSALITKTLLSPNRKTN
jgi:hypothetical protein